MWRLEWAAEAQKGAVSRAEAQGAELAQARGAVAELEKLVAEQRAATQRAEARARASADVAAGVLGFRYAGGVRGLLGSFCSVRCEYEAFNCLEFSVLNY